MAEEYRNLALVLTEFETDWKTAEDRRHGAQKPLSFSLEELKAMPSRTQITRHDCVEGWSAIGEWTGVPLSASAERRRD